jgi:xyloglucan-specific endo-beta-1,4-glucanase
VPKNNGVTPGNEAWQKNKDEEEEGANALIVSTSSQPYTTILTSKMLFQAIASTVLLALATASPVATPIEQSVTPVRRQAASLCSQYAYYAANGYEFNNNNWGKGAASSGSQCTTVQSTSGSGVSWSTSWTWAGGQNNVKSFANVGKQFARGLNMGKIKSMPTSITWDLSNRDVRADVAYDIFTAANPNHDTSSGDYELMIW